LRAAILDDTDMQYRIRAGTRQRRFPMARSAKDVTCSAAGGRIGIVPLDRVARSFKSKQFDPGPSGEDAEAFGRLAMSDHLSGAMRDGSADIRGETFPSP
jgi:hypothetical protein